MNEIYSEIGFWYTTDVDDDDHSEHSQFIMLLTILSTKTISRIYSKHAHTTRNHVKKKHFLCILNEIYAYKRCNSSHNKNGWNLHKLVLIVGSVNLMKKTTEFGFCLKFFFRLPSFFHHHRKRYLGFVSFVIFGSLEWHTNTIYVFPWEELNAIPDANSHFCDTCPHVKKRNALFLLGFVLASISDCNR